MSKFLKFAVVLFAVLLSFVSIHISNYSGLLSTCLKGVDNNYSSLCFFSESKQIPFDIQCKTENIVSQSINLPSPCFKNLFNNNAGSDLFLEIRLINITKQIILFSKGILPGLTISNIIYPFHYFW